MTSCAAQVVDTSAFRVHCFSSPDDGEAVNSHVIEGASRLLLLDLPLLEPYGIEFRDYVSRLGKPVDRIVVTHAHPDHWFTRSLFPNVACYAAQETLDEIAQFRDLFISSHRAMHADKLCATITGPEYALPPGTLDFDGLTFKVHGLPNTEDAFLLIVEHAASRTLLAQDLLYHGVHAYIGNRDTNGVLTLDRWLEALDLFRGMDFHTVIPGHGSPGDASLFGLCSEYLGRAREVIASVTDEKAYAARMVSLFPSYRAPLIAQISGYLLFH